METLTVTRRIRLSYNTQEQRLSKRALEL